MMFQRLLNKIHSSQTYMVILSLLHAVRAVHMSVLLDLDVSLDDKLIVNMFFERHVHLYFLPAGTLHSGIWPQAVLV